jgi:hypothetical protein
VRSASATGIGIASTSFSRNDLAARSESMGPASWLCYVSRGLYFDERQPIILGACGSEEASRANWLRDDFRSDENSEGTYAVPTPKCSAGASTSGSRGSSVVTGLLDVELLHEQDCTNVPLPRIKRGRWPLRP